MEPVVVTMRSAPATMSWYEVSMAHEGVEDGVDDQDGSEWQRTGWDTDPIRDYPIGPDDAGNAVMHGIGLLVSGWRWITSKFTNRA